MAIIAEARQEDFHGPRQGVHPELHVRRDRYRAWDCHEPHPRIVPKQVAAMRASSATWAERPPVAV